MVATARMRVLGLGQLSACGPGIEPLTGALSGEPPRPEWITTTKSEPFTRAPVLQARTEGTEDLVKGRAMRRLDRFTRSFVVATRLAVHDAGGDLPAPERIGVAMGTGHGSIATGFANLDEIIEFGDATSSPFKFSVSVNNAPSSCVSTALGVRGPCLTVTGFRDLPANVLALASFWLRTGAADLVVVGTGDEYHPVMAYGRQHDGGWAEDGRLQPLEFGRCSFVPGESYAVMIVGRAKGAHDGYGTIRAVDHYADLRRGYRPAAGKPLFLGADGRPGSGAVYRAVAARGNPVAAYAGLWGSSPAGEALTVLAACTTVRRGAVLGLPRKMTCPEGIEVVEQGAPVSESGIDCVFANADGSGSVIEITSGGD
jgi:3-oxoacyl-(acyl-carrier-protein) synthase